jgi:hypothetical protein
VTPPSQNPLTLLPRRFKPSKVYQIRPPHNSPVVKTLFQGFLPLNTMAHSWYKNLFKTLKLATFVGYPNFVPKHSHKWLPKFTGNDVVTPKDHLYAIGAAFFNEGVEHEGVVLRLLSMSLTKYAQRWFIGLPDNHPTSYDDFSKLLTSIWSTKKDSEMLSTQFNQIKKKENEPVN